MPFSGHLANQSAGADVVEAYISGCQPLHSRRGECRTFGSKEMCNARNLRASTTSGIVWGKRESCGALLGV
jgi:hypothetical protein